MKLGELKNLSSPIYRVKPYVILSNECIILSAGTLDEMVHLLIEFGDYYANCDIKVREYDLFMNDNTRLDSNKG